MFLSGSGMFFRLIVMLDLHTVEEQCLCGAVVHLWLFHHASIVLQLNQPQVLLICEGSLAGHPLADVLKLFTQLPSVCHKFEHHSLALCVGISVPLLLTLQI